MRSHWFLPETPDVLATLGAQADVTVRGLTAFGAWAGGARDQQAVVRESEHEADRLRRTLQSQLRRAFSTPMDQEDLYSLSELLDAALNSAKNIVREAEVLAIEPDQQMADLAAELVEAITHVRVAFAHLTDPSDVAVIEADVTLAAERRMEKAYRRAMHDLLAVQDLREVVARQEMYRRCLEVGERLASVAERIWYATMKEN
jgi:uncharacterized protein Yka (UPF0111/DUF47 family)